MEQNKNNFPQGWHLKLEYIHDDGTVWSKGKQQFNEDGSPMIKVKKDETDLSSESLKDNTKSEKPSLEEIVAKQQKELEDLKKLLIANTKKDSNPFDLTQFAAELAKQNTVQAGGIPYATAKDIDPEDYDEQGVNFFAQGNAYVIAGDKRLGKAIPNPLNPVILFSFKSGKKLKKGRNDEYYVSFCGYTSHSKTEIEWLRKSTFYGKKIFEDSTEVKAVDAVSIEAAHKAGKIVDALSGHQILAMAKQYPDIQMSSDMDLLRKILFKKLTEIEIQNINNKNKAVAQQNFEQGLFVTMKD